MRAAGTRSAPRLRPHSREGNGLTKRLADINWRKRFFPFDPVWHSLSKALLYFLHFDADLGQKADDGAESAR
jgi:hypothetical protein